MLQDYFVSSDIEIRNALKTKILARYIRNPETLVIDELGLENGSSRVDIAVVNHRLTGYEIKSDGDSLVRLHEQIRVYSSVLDRVVLVVGYRHAHASLQIVPPWWGVTLVWRGPDGIIEFREARRAKENPSPEPESVARMLWRDEALAMLDDLHASAGLRSKSRDILCATLAKTLPLDDLRYRVRQQLRSRTTWRAAPAQK